MQRKSAYLSFKKDWLDLKDLVSKVRVVNIVYKM